MSRLLEKVAVRVLQKSGPVASDILLLDLHNAYERDAVHKFNEGDVLVASSFNEDGDILSSGFGSRPVLVVKGYEQRPEEWANGRYGYRVDSYWDVRDSETGLYSRALAEEVHFKWNIEYLFRKYPEGATPEQAVDVYSVNLPGAQAAA